MKNVKKLFKLCCLSAVCVWLFTACSEPQHPQPPFAQVLDLSKPGVIYEQTFTVPSGREWAPRRLEFGQSHTNYEISLKFGGSEINRLQKERGYPFFENEAALDRYENEISPVLEKLLGVEARYPDDMTEKEWRAIPPVMKKKGLPVQLKVTLIPLENIKEPTVYLEGPYLYRVPFEKWRKKAALSQPIEVTLDLSTYGQPSFNSPRLHADKRLIEFPALQIGGNYRLRIENLNPLQLPESIEAELVMQLGRWKF